MKLFAHLILRLSGFATLFLLSESAMGASNLKLSVDASSCVIVYYDQTKDPNYWMGKTYSIMLQNLLGHFPHLQVFESAIEDYEKGDLDRCQASFYLGSYFENQIPQAFFEDFKVTTKQVAWLGYNIWMPGPQYFDEIFGFEYQELTTLNTEIKDRFDRPTFFKEVHYKNEIFPKFGEFSRDEPEKFLAGFENVRLRPSAHHDLRKAQILAEISHNGTGERTPYIIQSQNRFYVTDIPFSFIHEDDRYLVFADLLFDILQEQPQLKQPYAFVRVEDVFPQIKLPFVADIVNAIDQEGAKAHLSLIPLGVDPFQFYSPHRFVPVEESGKFLHLMQHYQEQGHEIIWHGVTHQYEMLKNPHSATSGADFEFWDANLNQPVEKDSPFWVVDRLEEGLNSMRRAGLKFQSWLTPHYQASALDYLIFARVFEWNVGRMIYFDYSSKEVPAHSENLLMNSLSPNAWKTRREAFKNLTVRTKGPWSGQFFPYIIFGDHYGQRVLPENIGNPQPYRSPHVIWPRSAYQMIQTAKRNRVLRDQWASFFYHPSLLDTTVNGGRGLYPGDAGELRYLIQEIKKLGYRFVTTSELTQEFPINQRRPQPLPLRSAK